MGLDDLLGDRQPEPGVLAEALIRPVGVEALENLVEGFRRGCPGRRRRPRSRPRSRSLRQVTRTVESGGANERALSIRLLITWPSRESCPGTMKASGPPPSKVTETFAASAAGLVLHRDHSVEELGEIDRRHLAALQFGVEAAGVGDVGDQPVEPLHVVLDHREQPLLAVRRFGERQRFHRRAQRRQRILQLMGDVGGEALDRLDPAVERAGHVAQRAGQIADLVAPRGQVGDFDAGADAVAHPLGAVGEPLDRAGDGARRAGSTAPP